MSHGDTFGRKIECPWSFPYERRRVEDVSGTNFIMMVIMILILLFVLVNIGPLVTF